MEQSIKTALVIALGFALGYTLYAMIGKGKSVVEKTPTPTSPQNTGNIMNDNADAFGDAVAGVMID